MYNLFHYKELKHNQEAYKTFGVKKALHRTISSEDFKGLENKLNEFDTTNSAITAPQNPIFNTFPSAIQEGIKKWSDEGFMILKNYLSAEEVDQINNDVETKFQTGEFKYSYINKIMFAYKKSTPIRNAFINPDLYKLLDFLLGRKTELFQTINFFTGSQQRAHSDFVHMSTFPYGNIIAVWIALEDIDPDSGPIFYYPKSHKLPYLMNGDYNHGGSDTRLGKNNYKNYEDALEAKLAQTDLEKVVFAPKKGDAFIWHPNLVHGGSPVKNKELTRKSMVAHYYAQDVIKYHEISQRPTLMTLHRK